MTDSNLTLGDVLKSVAITLPEDLLRECIRETYDADDIVRELDIDAGDVASNFAAYEIAEHVSEREVADYLDEETIAKHVAVDEEEVARHINFDLALNSEKVATLERMLDEQRTLHLKLKQRLERLEDLLGQAPTCREEV